MGSGKRGHVQGGSDGCTSAPDLALFVREAVERVEMGRFQVNARVTPDAQYHPRMMLALLNYCYANGIFPAGGLSMPPFGISECATWRPIPTRITQCASDRNVIVATVETIPQEVGCPGTVWADNGFACGEEVETSSERGIDALVATGAQGGQRQYDFRPPKDAGPPRDPSPTDC